VKTKSIPAPMLWQKPSKSIYHPTGSHSKSRRNHWPKVLAENVAAS
jgi:hypothetical protein